MNKSISSLKTLVIGLDGATFDIILPFIKEGRLSTFAMLLEKGAWGELESTIPPITAAAWTSFMTGCNPGRHGIIDFIKTDGAGAVKEEVVTTGSFAGKTFFDLMAGKDLKVGAVTVPVTYPPWDINCVMISGYPCPDSNGIYAITKGITLNIDEPLNFSAEYYRNSTEEQIIEDCIHRDRLRADLSMDLLRRYEFDCFTVVLGGIDRSQHDYWKYHDPDYPNVSKLRREKFKDSIYRNYKLADDVISEFLKIYGDNTNIFILSDHGAGRYPSSYFNINLWLKKNGFLKTINRKAVPREVLKLIYFNLMRLLTPNNKKKSSVLPKLHRQSKQTGGGSGKVFNWNHTKAFFHPLLFPAGGIMINLRGRQASGIVNSGSEYDELRDEIIRKLLEVREPKTGENVIVRAYRREEVYNGPYVGDFPDIIYILNNKYESGRMLYGKTISRVPDFVLSKKSGMHLMNGILIGFGPMIKPGRIDGARIVDIAPTIIYSTELPVPGDMDGIVLKEIFRDEILSKKPIEYFDWSSKSAQADTSLNRDEEEQMKAKLRGLGYL